MKIFHQKLKHLHQALKAFYLLAFTLPVLSAPIPKLEKSFPPADPATLPCVPAIRPLQTDKLKLDGILDEDSWQKSVVYSEFGLDTGDGPTDHPTRLRFLTNKKNLWLGLECETPPSRTTDKPENIENCTIEIFLDNTFSRRIFYHLLLKPNGEVSIPGWKNEDARKACSFVVSRQTHGFTMEICLNLPSFSEQGQPNPERIGFNLARNSNRRWASLASLIGQGQKPEQFWTILLTESGNEVLPTPAYSPLFQKDTDLPSLLASQLADWETLKGKNFQKPPLLEIRIQNLIKTRERAAKDSWGAPVPMASAIYRTWLAWKELVPEELQKTTPSFTAVSNALLPEAETAYPEASLMPKSGWRECAFSFSEDRSIQPYALYVPKADTQPRSLLPLVVYLHGAKSNAFSSGLILERYQPPANFLIARVNTRKCNRYEASEKREVMEVIEDICAHWPVDPARISLLGFSTGAFAAPQIALENPGRFSAIVMAAGQLPEKGIQKLIDLPLTAIWGAEDDKVPFNSNEAIQLQQLNPKSPETVRLFLLPSMDHAEPLSGMEFWLASQSKKEKPTSPVK